MRKTRFSRNIKIILMAVLLIVFSATLYVNLAAESVSPIPVDGATDKNWDINSYWFSPWGKSKVHKGIDIFAPRATKIISPVSGIVLGSGFNENGGNFIYIIGPKLRVYYFAHLNRTYNGKRITKQYQILGEVGNSGNAINKPCHLHYSVFSLLPVFSNYKTGKPKGIQRLFYLDPAINFR